MLRLETTDQDPGQGLTRKAIEHGADLVLAAGGDGTVMACVTALAGSGVPLAVLPVGTGNLLALNLGLPEDLEGALHVALHDIDVGAMGADRFVLMAGLGFDAAMLRDTDPKLKARIGPLADVLSGLGQLRRRPARLALRLDDQPSIARVGQGVLIANVGRLQGGVTVVSEARPDDGLLDIAVLGTRTPVDWLRLAARVLLRRRRRAPDQHGQASSSESPRLRLETFRARHIEIDSDLAVTRLPWTAVAMNDGHPGSTPKGSALKRMDHAFSQQLAKPHGVLGRMFGRALAKQNLGLNTWMVDLLDVQPHDRVLEVGCGPGTAIEQLAAKAPSGFVAGVDYSPVMVAQASDRNRLAIQAGTVEVKEGDAAHLPYPEGRFDAVCGVNVLYFWPAPLVALGELRRVLNHAGRLALAYQVEAHTPPRMRRAFSQAGYHMVTTEQIEGLLTQAGFTQVRTEVKPGPQEPEGFCTLGRKRS